MSSAKMNLSHLQANYAGQYVALLDDRPIASGRTFRDALRAAERKGIIEREELSFRFIPPWNKICIF